ncbi:MAG: hypothetical protein PUF94_06345, partial [Collinsella sp.]|nr:hypothetical protein [Collinsella sp.]
YEIADRAELEQVIRDVYASGYTDDLILQDRVPGNDEYMRVLTSYSDRNGKVRMMCLGHVLLEEHQPHGVGNHACIITEPNDELMGGVRKLLEDLKLRASQTLTSNTTSATVRLSSSTSTLARAAVTTTSPTVALTLPST